MQEIAIESYLVPWYVPWAYRQNVTVKRYSRAQHTVNVEFKAMICDFIIGNYMAIVFRTDTVAITFVS